jgi:hypothetical protein
MAAIDGASRQLDYSTDSDRGAEVSEPERQRAALSDLQDERLEPIMLDVEHASRAVVESESTEPVYARASARVPKRPEPGHEALVQRVDATTSERRAAEQDHRSASDEHKVPHS